MLTIENTDLQSFNFGENPEDKYYLLINKKVNPNGINLERLSKANPAKFDSVLADMGCIIMLSGDEIDELIRRGNMDENKLHESIFEFARNEGAI